MVLFVERERQTGRETGIMRAVDIGTITVSEVGFCRRLGIVQKVMLESVLVSVAKSVSVGEVETDVIVMGRARVEEAVVLQAVVATNAVTARNGAVEGISAQKLSRIWRHQAVHPGFPPVRRNVLCKRRTRGIGEVRPMQVFQRGSMVEVTVFECSPKCPRLLQTDIVGRIYSKVVAPPREERTSEGIAFRKERLARAVVGVVYVRVGSVKASLIAEVLVLLVETIGSERVAGREALCLP